MEQIADLSMLGFGLSDRTDHAQFDILLSNLGAARLEQGEGSIPIETGDHFLRDEKVDFIKIDTEGLELKVLRGLPSTIARNKPAIFVEVENRNLDNFLAFVQELNYRIEWRYRRYPWNENYLILPR